MRTSTLPAGLMLTNDILGRHLRKTFPDSFLMYRTTSEPDRARTNGDEEGTAVFQLNQSARVVMKMLKVPLFHCKYRLHL